MTISEFNIGKELLESIEIAENTIETLNRMKCSTKENTFKADLVSFETVPHVFSVGHSYTTFARVGLFRALPIPEPKLSARLASSETDNTLEVSFDIFFFEEDFSFLSSGSLSTLIASALIFKAAFSSL